MGDLDISAVRNEFVAWFASEIWTRDTIIQLVVLAVSFGIATLVNRLLRDRIRRSISDMPVSYRVKSILQNIRRLIPTTVAAFLIFLVSVVLAGESFSMDTAINVAVMKLLLAWIAIRLALQFIRNGFVRNIFAVFIWTIAALSILGVLDQTVAALDAFGMNVGEFRLSALVLIKGIFAIFILLYLAIFISGFLERSISGAKDLTPTSRVLISKIIRVTLVTVALLIGLTSAGIDLSLLAVFSGAVGLGLGFGLQKGVSNLFSGILLLMDKSIKPGDVIELENEIFGWVHYMGARFTEIITRDNKSFLVPNEEFITNRVVNWSHGSTLIRLEVGFGVHYESEPHMVKRIAEEVASKPDRVVSDPKPQCHLAEFGDSSLDFKLRFWIEDAQKGVTNMRGDVMLALWDAFKENGIKIPYPHREVYVRELPGDKECSMYT
jgi:small-conductance mechanosensitive channel